MGIEDIDELELPRNGSKLPPPLPEDATRAEMIAALNVVVRAIGEQGAELQMIREAVQEQGTRIETFCQRIERALGVARERTTDPAPAG